MNSPSPLVPQGSLLEQKNTGRSRVKLAVFCVLAIHVFGLMALLMQGCKREQTASLDTNLPPVLDTNLPPMDAVLPPAVTSAPPDLVQQLPPTPPPITQEYAIQRGDSFSTIAGKFPGVTAKAIQDANPGVDPLKLQIGKKIVIPPPTAAPSVAPNGGAVLPPGDAGEQIHVVKSGDVLIKIANQYGTTVKAIQDANNLSDTRIKVGQKLKIPVKSPSPSAPPGP